MLVEGLPHDGAFWRQHIADLHEIDSRKRDQQKFHDESRRILGLGTRPTFPHRRS